MEPSRPESVERMIPGLPRKEVVEALHILNRQGEVAQRKFRFF